MSKLPKIVKIAEHCQNGQKLPKWQKKYRIIKNNKKLAKNCQNYHKLSKLPKIFKSVIIVKIAKKCQNCQKQSKAIKNWLKKDKISKALLSE